MSVTSDNEFSYGSSRSDDFSSSTPGLSETTSRVVEFAYLVGVIMIVTVGMITGFIHVTALWLASYLFTVFGGVTLLALYRRKATVRLAAVANAESRRARLFQGCLAVLLGSAAVLNAVHLAVKWSS